MRPRMKKTEYLDGNLKCRALEPAFTVRLKR